MGTVITENFIANVIKEFNQRFPQYKDELKVFSSNDDELTFAFHGINHITTLSKLNHDYGLENWKDDELLWLNITNLFDNITSVYERDKLGDTIEKLAENIKAQLIEISKRADVDMNTLWISFKTSMEDLENDLKLDKTT